MKNTYYKILNEIAAVFDMDQWDEQVNMFTDVIDKQLNAFVHNTEYDWICILENYRAHVFPQYNFYKERCYVKGEKVKLDNFGAIENKWKDKETVNVIIEDLDKLGESCACMFFKCFSLVSVPLFNTSRVTDMKEMFYHCSSLVSVPWFNTSGVNNMYCMFFNCPSLSEKTKQDWSSVYNFKTNKKK